MNTNNPMPIGLLHYIDYMMLKYAGIFPNPLRVLEHLFFVNGNGYKYHNNKVCLDESRKPTPIEDYTTRNKMNYIANRNIVVVECVAEDIRTRLNMSIRHYELFGNKSLSDFISDTCKKCITEITMMDSDIITEHDLTIFALKHQLKEHIKSIEQRFKRFSVDNSLPYPISKGYAICYEMSNKTPLWIVELCYNVSFVYLEYMKTIPDDFESKNHNLKEMITNLEEVVSNCKNLLNA